MAVPSQPGYHLSTLPRPGFSIHDIDTLMVAISDPSWAGKVALATSKKVWKHKMLWYMNHNNMLNILKSPKVKLSVTLNFPLAGGLWRKSSAGPMKTGGA